MPPEPRPLRAEQPSFGTYPNGAYRLAPGRFTVSGRTTGRSWGTVSRVVGKSTLAGVWPQAVAVGDQLGVRVAVIRGGTSRGVYFHAGDLPDEGQLRDRVILAVYGSPDDRQIDGLGGGHPLTSKVAIVSRSARPDADVDYLFGQVRVSEPVIDYSGICGNLLAGIGPFAVDEGLVSAVEPVTEDSAAPIEAPARREDEPQQVRVLGRIDLKKAAAPPPRPAQRRTDAQTTARPAPSTRTL